MKKWQMGLMAGAALIVCVAAYVLVQARSLEVERLSDDLFVLRGLGGNSAVLRTDAGAVVVDSMTLKMQGEGIRDIARELTGMETVLLINTHYHSDHTHGNVAFAPGTRVLSTERTLSHLHALDAEFWQGDAARLLPTETFSDHMTLVVGGKTIELIHPGAGHTDGDLVVLFTDEGVLHTGDLMWHQYYPNIDLEAGGSVQEWVASLESLLRLDFTRVIPGHGETTDRNGMRRFLAVIAQLAEIARTAADKGRSLEQTLETDQLTADKDFRQLNMIVPLGMDREFVLTRAWEETTDNFTRLN